MTRTIILLLSLAGMPGLSTAQEKPATASPDNPSVPVIQDKEMAGCRGGGIGFGGSSQGDFYVFILGCPLEKLQSLLLGNGAGTASGELREQLEQAVAVLGALAEKHQRWIGDYERSRKNHQDLIGMQTAGQDMAQIIAAHNAQVSRHADAIADEDIALGELMNTIAGLQKQLEVRADEDTYLYLDSVVETLASLADYRLALDNLGRDFRRLVINPDEALQ